MDIDKFIFCLEAVTDIEEISQTNALINLENLARNYGIGSIYKTCDTIEGLEDSLNALLYDDNNFDNYEIIYLVMGGDANSINIAGYYYSLIEIAEIFEGKMKGKILHFSNAKMLDLTPEESQYFLDVTGARAISGYGVAMGLISSDRLDKEFFNLYQDEADLISVVEMLHLRYYDLCRQLDFRLYY